MNRRSFLGLGFKGALLGAAISIGLSVTRITTVNQYSILYSFTDKFIGDPNELSENGIPHQIEEQVFQRMGLMADEKKGKIVDFKQVSIPVEQITKEDPLGQIGYCGLVFNLEEAA